MFLVFSLTSSCTTLKGDTTRSQVPELSQQELDKYATAYFASGCFWCVEAVYESVEGVVEAVSGYAGGETNNPTYESIGTGRTGHAETVKVYYDPAKVSFADLLKVFFNSGDPTTPNRQGPDAGSQYRSIIFYETAEEKKIAETMIAQLEEAKIFSSPIITEITEHVRFFEAEDYHQNFERLNPNHPYVQAVSLPRLNRFKQASPDLLKK